MSSLIDPALEMSGPDNSGRKRFLIFVVAYNAERTIEDVLRRIPASLAQFDTEILIIDDSSQDRTFQAASAFRDSPFPITVLFNPVNQGYGGNQKVGFHYAIEKGFDYVALLHGDGQYAPELLPELLQPLLDGKADAVFGSRMMRRGEALSGGMPLYKYVGNRILTAIQNRLLKTNFSELHSGYRLYSVHALARVPFRLNTRDFHFDTEIIIQFVRAGFRIRELPIPTYYGDEICHVNGMKYALDAVKASAVARLQEFGVMYERKFDVLPPENFSNYEPKLTYKAPHTLALQRVPPRSRVIDIGCASGYMACALHQKTCVVTGVDQYTPYGNLPLERFVQHDLNNRPFPLDIGAFDYVLLLDVIEHLQSPEAFVESLRASWKENTEARVIASTGNIAFFVTRLMLLSGMFHYGRRGILDLTHTRLFTFRTFRSLFEQAGYQIEEVIGVPAPYPLALGDGRLARFLLWINQALIGVSKSLFSYQIFVVARPLPPMNWLLRRAIETGKEKSASVQSA
jgi:glycosyltransferase involved in cell wall biosynthesis